jgi:hypothetical protein
MKEILNSHPVNVLRKEISKTNIKGYSKLKKAELITLMVKHKDRFTHIKMADNKKVPAKPVDPPKPKPKSPAKPKKAPLDKQYKANYWYSSGGKNEFLNDMMDSKSHKTGRKVGYKRVINKLQTYLNKQKRAGKSVSGDDVVTYLLSAYPENEYYLE